MILNLVQIILIPPGSSPSGRSIRREEKDNNGLNGANNFNVYVLLNQSVRYKSHTVSAEP